ncbi:MAG TPA: sigma 54-interacting transcriptional regulator [Gemmatimonadales bacterium]|nr:sigma 54-interacting transcriptional regulator [Gemmatimonadales bacterium]
MAQAEWRVELALFSDSFRSTVAGLVEELGGTVSASKPGDDRHPAWADVILLLAGGAESEALDFLADSGSAGARYLIGAAADHRIAAAALQSGARDYFALPDDLDLLRRCLERLAREAASRIEAGRFADAERRATGFEAIIGSSPALRQTLDQAARVAPLRDLTVLIGGETGTGKELLARALHYGSPRAGDPFVEVNCAAIPSNLLESELFGHERGAFTGAVAAKPGLLEIAHGGTLFLDEIGTLPLELQPKLLRALETRSIRRVGGQQSRQVDVRVVAASHVDLGRAVRQGEFREDLYYRLNVVTLVLPPLREREGDVELLARTFVERIATSYGLPVPELSQETRTALRAHRWPGNVRELRNVLERAVVLSPAGTLRLGPLEDARGRGDSSTGVLPFPAPLAEVVRTAAQVMLDLTGGNKSEAARRLGISRPRLQRLLDGNLEE